MRLVIATLVPFAIISLTIGCKKAGTNNAPTTQQAGSNSGASSSFQEQIAESSRRVDAELAGWAASSRDLERPPDKLCDRSIDVAGNWVGRTGMDSAYMRITHRPGSDYDIVFKASGCLDRWRLERTGHFQNGVMTLDRPVREYCPITFDRFYTIRVDGKELLLPAPSIDKLLEDLDAQGRAKHGSIGVRFYTYGRASDRGIDANR